MRPDQWRTGESRLHTTLHALLANAPYHIGTPFDLTLRRRWPGMPSATRHPVQGLVEVELAADAARLAVGDELVAARYASRGYRVDSQEVAGTGSKWRREGHLTLLGFRDGAPVGTITVGMDSNTGLLLDEGNGEVLDLLRRAGRRIAEFIRLAVRDEANSAVYYLFRRAYELARTLELTTDILMEVNPRHVAFYEKVFGFAVVGHERICPRVNAPAVMMRLDLVELDRERGIPAQARLPARPAHSLDLEYAAA